MWVLLEGIEEIGDIYFWVDEVENLEKQYL